MMKLEEHEKETIKKFGRPFSEVHAFLDQFFREFGSAHRRILHHQRGVDLIVARFGDEAGAVAVEHILNDIRITDPLAVEIPRDWEWYGDPILVRLEDYDRLEAVIKDLYELEG